MIMTNSYFGSTFITMGNGIRRNKIKAMAMTTKLIPQMGAKLTAIMTTGLKDIQFSVYSLPQTVAPEQREKQSSLTIKFSLAKIRDPRTDRLQYLP